jgi:hypothetical protein
MDAPRRGRAQLVTEFLPRTHAKSHTHVFNIVSSELKTDKNK